MNDRQMMDDIMHRYINKNDHAASDYFAVIRELVAKRNKAKSPVDKKEFQQEIDAVYRLLDDEITHYNGLPRKAVSFGTSGWRGILGKDLYVRSVLQVTQAIIEMYRELDLSKELVADLGVGSFAEAKARGCVLGHDNRFGGDLFCRKIADLLTSNGFRVHFTGEATTGTISAAIMDLDAAFSINITPSHNPLEYGGFKFNAADAGPASPSITSKITEKTRFIMAAGLPISLSPDPSLVSRVNVLDCWMNLVRSGYHFHGLDYDRIMAELARRNDITLVVDCVHGASRVQIRQLLKNIASDRIVLLRTDNDPTFGGIAPEPSSENMQAVHDILAKRPEPFKLGAIIDPDADRIRFTDGRREISMNHFGAMGFHHLHEHKKKKGMVAKSVATSNFANAIAASLGEEVFEPKVGFKEFKPVIDRALVCFEESDGITAIGHTPEKDAYIGLLLALDMVISQQQNLGDYLLELENKFGKFFPERDSVAVTRSGKELLDILGGLTEYRPGKVVQIGKIGKHITKIIDIDGYKMIFEDGSWIMIRPSGTEPKVRFYYEARTAEDRTHMLAAAKRILAELGLA